jgi:tripartite-type tricarboxylate transporter receptor subunit TctC
MTGLIRRGRPLRCAHLTAFAAIVLLACAAGAPAADPGWRPQRPVRLLIPQVPGGAADASARAFTPKFHEMLGQPWVLDNRAGAAGNIAAELAAQASPDGQTVLLGLSTSITANPSLYKLPYDPRRDFAAIAMVTAGQYVLVLHPSVKAESLRDFIALAKARPGTIHFSSGGGTGAPSHLAAELLKSRTGIDVVHVPYKGGAPATNAVIAGEVQMMFANLVLAVPQIRAGRLRALGVAGLKRAPIASDIPTIAEQGYPDFEMTSWYGLFVPAKTPPRIVDAIGRAAERALTAQDVVETLARQGLEAAFKNAADFRAHIDRESAMWARVISERGIRAP